MNTINITAYTDDNTQIEAIKAVLQALKIKYEIGSSKPYNQEFVEKIKQGEEDFKNGDFKIIKTKDLWK